MFGKNKKIQDYPWIWSSALFGGNKGLQLGRCRLNKNGHMPWTTLDLHSWCYNWKLMMILPVSNMLVVRKGFICVVVKKMFIYLFSSWDFDPSCSLQVKSQFTSLTDGKPLTSPHHDQLWGPGACSPSWAPGGSTFDGWRIPCTTPVACAWILKPMRTRYHHGFRAGKFGLKDVLLNGVRKTIPDYWYHLMSKRSLLQISGWCCFRFLSRWFWGSTTLPSPRSPRITAEGAPTALLEVRGHGGM